MTTEATPREVGSHAGLGLAPERATCECCAFMHAATREAQEFASHYADEVLALRARLAEASAAFEREQARADAAEIRAETAQSADSERCAKLREKVADMRHYLREAHGFAAMSPRGKENIATALEILDELGA